MAMLLSLSMMALVHQVCSWERKSTAFVTTRKSRSLTQRLAVVTYNNVRNCQANGDTIYRIFDGDSDSLGVCQGIAGAPSNSKIRCQEYTQGGAQPPTACGDRGEHNFYAESVAINDTTSFGGVSEQNIFCQFYASASCDNDDQSPQEACLAPYGLGAVSFKCVSLEQPSTNDYSFAKDILGTNQRAAGALSVEPSRSGTKQSRLCSANSTHHARDTISYVLVIEIWASIVKYQHHPIASKIMSCSKSRQLGTTPSNGPFPQIPKDLLSIFNLADYTI